MTESIANAVVESIADAGILLQIPIEINRYILFSNMKYNFRELFAPTKIYTKINVFV